MSEKTKNKIFWSVFILCILGSIIFTFLRVFIYKDYILVAEVSCDPQSESCFMYTSEELCAESEDVECVSNTEAEYYKIIYKKAANVPVCNPSDLEEGEECSELTCEDGESEEECYYEYNEEEI